MDHHDKLAWAERHLEALRAEIDAFFDSDPISSRVEIDRERQRITIYGSLRVPKPPHWPLMIGDILQNMRSALDYIVWEFSARNMAVKRLSELKAIQFPICTRPDDYWGQKPNGRDGQRYRRMEFVNEAARIEIDAMQPFNSPDFPRDHALAMLNELSNTDKHHKLILALTATRLPRVSFRGFGGPILQKGQITEYLVTTAEDDTPIIAVDFLEPISEGSVEVHPRPTGMIIFHDALPTVGGSPVIETLKYIADGIRQGVFPALDRHLI